VLLVLKQNLLNLLHLCSIPKERVSPLSFLFAQTCKRYPLLFTILPPPSSYVLSSCACIIFYKSFCLKLFFPLLLVTNKRIKGLLGHGHEICFF
jgi:hypothetical protein